MWHTLVNSNLHFTFLQFAEFDLKTILWLSICENVTVYIRDIINNIKLIIIITSDSSVKPDIFVIMPLYDTGMNM